MRAGEDADETALLERAGQGDPDAFGDLVAAYHSELRAHCYRMLGSVHDAEDALQEALVRAWRGLPGFEGRASVRTWLYSIATNTSLDAAKHRARRELPVDFAAAAGQGADLAAPLTELPWLEPFPDAWAEPDARAAPDARFERRESVELAFVAALQYLPPLQRAALLLREVVGFSTEEISRQLDRSAPSVNSALQRARASVRGRLPARSQQETLNRLGERRTRELAERYADAIERGDVDTLIGMLTDDATWSMPPHPTWYQGHAAIRDFLVRYPLRLSWRHLPTRANGQLAVACYLLDAERGRHVPAVIDVLTLDGDKIAAVTAFLAAETLDPPDRGPWTTGPDLFSRFPLPQTLD